MGDSIRVFGSEMSPYSVKVRSYLRWRGLEHRWIVRDASNRAEFEELARLPLIPLVVTEDGDVLQDSTPILETLDARRDDVGAGEGPPSMHPDDAVLRFASALLEEFADEWANKWMFHFRWAREVDQVASAGRIARSMMPAATEEEIEGLAAQIRQRMTGRVWFVGSSPENAPFLEETFGDVLALLDAHLAGRPYLFGRRPVFADFGLAAQLYCLWTDPTPGALIEAHGRSALAWIQRMLWPVDLGELESWDELAPTLEPLLRGPVAELFVPWTLANAAALEAGEEEMTVELRGHAWRQKPQKYHAKSLQALRERMSDSHDSPRLSTWLAGVGCARLVS